jgi:hypothetical protein
MLEIGGDPASNWNSAQTRCVSFFKEPLASSRHNAGQPLGASRDSSEVSSPTGIPANSNETFKKGADLIKPFLEL